MNDELDDLLRKLIREKIGGRALQKGSGDLAKKMKKGLLSGLMSKGAAAAAVMDEQLETTLQHKRLKGKFDRTNKLGKKKEPGTLTDHQKRLLKYCRDHKIKITSTLTIGQLCFAIDPLEGEGSDPSSKSKPKPFVINRKSPSRTFVATFLRAIRPKKT